MFLAALTGHTSIIELLVDQYHCSLTDVNNVSDDLTFFNVAMCLCVWYDKVLIILVLMSH